MSIMSNLIEQHTHKLHSALDRNKQKDINHIRDAIIEVINQEVGY